MKTRWTGPMLMAGCTAAVCFCVHPVEAQDHALKDKEQDSPVSPTEKEVAKPDTTKGVGGAALDLSRVENDVLSMGLFPNSQGYLDARFHLRHLYLTHFSSAVYFDYTTFRYEEGEEGREESEELVREYRVDVDMIKYILPLHTLLGLDKTQVSFEPGLNAKGILQSIDATSISTNSFGERVFSNEDAEFRRLVLSAKAEVTLAVGEAVTLDFSGEYIPLIFSQEEATVISSQFDGTVSPQTLKSVTSGLQATAAFRFDSGAAGRFTLSGKFFLDSGLRSATSVIIDGNYKYESVDTARSRQQDVWLELVHDLTYLKQWTVLTPAVALAVQHRAISVDAIAITETTYKIGLLVEFD